jgi:hypothetical protein
MKGMVFTEFFNLVESAFGADMLDDIIDDANLPNDGAYTAVGTYDHMELVAMVVALSTRSGMPVPDLVKTFGTYLFGQFVTLYPKFFVNVNDSFVFLLGIEDIIHAEVLKLYPDANLPKFDVQLQVECDELIMTYHSNRHFADLAEGLIIGAAQHFNETFDIVKTNLDENSTQFRITRQ